MHLFGRQRPTTQGVNCTESVYKPHNGQPSEIYFFISNPAVDHQSELVTHPTRSWESVLASALGPNLKGRFVRCCVGFKPAAPVFNNLGLRLNSPLRYSNTSLLVNGHISSFVNVDNDILTRVFLFSVHSVHVSACADVCMCGRRQRKN